MSSRWIIFLLLAALVIILSPGVESENHSEKLLKESTQQLNLILESINELERQRIQEKENGANLNSDTSKQRPNSKKLRWNRRRTLPDPGEPEESENRALVTSTSIVQTAPNPDYLNVNNYLATPAPWWFN
ncbi:uncharacterized protein LOC108092835 [Drosophila ficusphila]|uniref:uncharacterized protein LOC108092835 n=1 Tax=Drosophila ficusphila TaxID=30025 RepID=UPI0007E664BB|nr:uncharacterized protein LOC108092835 [Drosophila ficusphila]